MKSETAEQDFNPYQAPRTNVADVAGAQEPVFFPISTLKLALMSIVTFGLYEIYWFYQNWKLVQHDPAQKLNAPIRAVFYPIMAYALFRRIAEAAAREQLGTLQAGALAVAVFVMSALWRLPDPWWLVSFLSFVPLLPVQQSVNALNRKLAPQADPNRRFSAWNIFGLVAGGLFFLLALIGVFVPE